jgi:hypothetical protein
VPAQSQPCQDARAANEQFALDRRARRHAAERQKERIGSGTHANNASDDAPQPLLSVTPSEVHTRGGISATGLTARKLAPRRVACRHTLAPRRRHAPRRRALGFA